MDFSNMTRPQLIDQCKECGIKRYSKKNKAEIIELLEQHYEDASSEDSDELSISVDSDASSIDSDASMDDGDYVIVPCKAPEEYIKEHMAKCLTNYFSETRLQYHKDTGTALYVEDNIGEYYCAKSTNGKLIGAGNASMDVETSANNGIDVFCVNTKKNNNDTNEKSLIQNFETIGVNLDNLYKEKQDTQIVKLFTDGYLRKLTKVSDKYGNLFYHGLISTKTDIYDAWFKINLNNIKNISSGGFITGGNSKGVNIIVNNVINPKYGGVKAYKSKKRMELRLKLKQLIKEDHAKKIYTMPSSA